MVEDNKPILLVFSSGTSGKPAKPILYTLKDFSTLKRGIKRFFEIYKNSGIFYNLLPFAPHLAFYFAAMYGEASGSLMVNTGGGKHMTTEKTVSIMKNSKPEIIAGIPFYIIKVLEHANEEGVDLSKVAVVIGANGIDDDFVKEVKTLCPNAVIYATYGFTEARCAWTTCNELSLGYHVFPESGRFERDNGNGELIFYSYNYPNGFRTGDKGEILGGEICPNCGQECQRIGFKIERLDGMKKVYEF